jgi:predicted DNA-binding transcriptional regulator AlpA
MEPMWLTEKQVAHRCGVSRQYIAVHRGTPDAPPYHKRGARKILYLSSEVEDWIKSQRVA